MSFNKLIIEIFDSLDKQRKVVNEISYETAQRATNRAIFRDRPNQGERLRKYADKKYANLPKIMVLDNKNATPQQCTIIGTKNLEDYGYYFGPSLLITDASDLMRGSAKNFIRVNKQDNSAVLLRHENHGSTSTLKTDRQGRLTIINLFKSAGIKVNPNSIELFEPSQSSTST